MLLRVEGRNGTIEATRSATIARKMAIFRETARKIQKASVGFSNLCTGN